MRQRLPIVLSITALVVALLGWTPVGEAGRNFFLPKNSVGKREIEKNAVGSSEIINKSIKRKDLRKGIINSRMVQNNSLRSEDIEDEEIESEDIKDGEIEGRDIKDNAIEGEDIDESSLSQVPDADKVDGHDAECPPGTTMLPGYCLETEPRPALSWTSASADCGAWGGRLPTADELYYVYYVRDLPGIDLTTGELSSDLSWDTTVGTIEYLSVADGGAIGHSTTGTSGPYRCIKSLVT